MAIVPDGVHPGIQQVKQLVGVVFWGIISYRGASQFSGDKCGKLNGVETTQAGGVSGFE